MTLRMEYLLIAPFLEHSAWPRRIARTRFGRDIEVIKLLAAGKYVSGWLPVSILQTLSQRYLSETGQAGSPGTPACT